MTKNALLAVCFASILALVWVAYSQHQKQNEIAQAVAQLIKDDKDMQFVEGHLMTTVALLLDVVTNAPDVKPASKRYQRGDSGL